MHRGGQRSGARAQPQHLVRHTRTIKMALPAEAAGVLPRTNNHSFCALFHFSRFRIPKKTESNQLKGNQSNSFAAERGGQALHDLLLSRSDSRRSLLLTTRTVPVEGSKRVSNGGGGWRYNRRREVSA